MKNLTSLITKKDATIGVIGLGYVGLPLAIQFLNKGFNVIGYDVDNTKVGLLENNMEKFRKKSERKRVLNV